MSVVSKPGEKEQSYELRMQDYINAYRSTGRPPKPCPQTPSNPVDRKALGLPPLFQPHGVESIPSIITSAPSISSVTITPPVLPSTTPTPQRVDPAAVPDIQVFQPIILKGDSGESFTCQSIVIQQLYSSFSFEELRCLAYRRGKKTAPLDAIISRNISTPQPQLRIATPSLSVSQPTPLMIGGSDHLLCISCTPAYAKHSPEELRLAYVRTGRELTSDEIIQRNATLRMF
ncbi:unnamed protein product [Somion occarium]|uniref:Uncharacterized protein n=1 Tax=Somion occarium TaxID=3059160 RepID=A0ABP1DV27_9APHY